MHVRRLAVVALALVAGCARTHDAKPSTAAAHSPATTSAATPATAASAPNPSSTSPVGPASTTTATPTATQIPALNSAAVALGFVDVRTAVPDSVIDLRYATADNFTHVQLYPSIARCLIHRDLADGIAAAANTLRRQALRLVFWDCYRPHSVQVRMYDVVPDPDWVAKPGPYSRSHETGRSVDVTLADRAGHYLDMGTGFDDFTSRAHAYATAGLTTTQVGNRRLLRDAMRTGGLDVYDGEWWHFDGPGAFVHRPVVDVPLT